MRSLLFVPGDSERKLEKGLASGADVIYAHWRSTQPNREAGVRMYTLCTYCVFWRPLCSSQPSKVSK